MASRHTVVHAYGVLCAGSEVELPVAGVLGARVERLRCGPYDVVASTLPEFLFGQRRWEEKGQDPEWLAPIARQHHEVLQRITVESDVLPLRLPGVYRDASTLCETVLAMQDRLTTAFEVVRGHVEWTVKVWRNNVRELPVQPRPATGADYLRGRAQAAKERDTSRQRAGATALDVHEALEIASAHAVLSPVQDKAVTGRDESMVLNAAYLVARSHQERFFAAADQEAARWGPDGFSIEVTGPWPPYSFSSLRLQESTA